jgi:cytochrome c oxidase assembly protein subunit 20
MASGMGTDEPPPIPPPDYRKVSTADFAKQQMPPLRGLMVDPQYPPTVDQANKILNKPNEAHPRPPQRSDGEAQRTQEPETDVRRSSGASQIFNTAPTIGEVVNTMPLGTRHTAGGETPIDASPLTVLKSIKRDDWKSFHKQPCVREALLQGITLGFFTGGALFITGRPLAKAANWAAGAFVATSVAGHTYCQVQRKRERQGMKVAVQIIEEKKEERRRQAEERRERYRKAKEERRLLEVVEAKREQASRSRWWWFWEGRGREG